jgi:hypothetical protein
MMHFCQQTFSIESCDSMNFIDEPEGSKLFCLLSWNDLEKYLVTKFEKE